PHVRRKPASPLGKHALSGVLRGSQARALHVSRRSACRWTAARTVVGLHAGRILLIVILALGLQLNLSVRAPRELYRTVAGLPTLGARVVTCVGPDSAGLARVRGYLRPELCAGGVQPVLKRVIAVAGDVVEGRTRGADRHGPTSSWELDRRRR